MVDPQEIPAKRAERLSAESRTHQFLEFAALYRDAATINCGFCSYL
jgi:hypothetical protein